jgi:copper chaperone CopZ
MITKMYKVAGMQCDGCVKSVKNAIKSVPGVIEAQVQLQEPNAIVSMQNDILDETLQSAIHEKGQYILSSIADKESNPVKKSKQGILHKMLHKKDCCQ